MPCTTSQSAPQPTTLQVWQKKLALARSWRHMDMSTKRQLTTRDVFNLQARQLHFGTSCTVPSTLYSDYRVPRGRMPQKLGRKWREENKTGYNNGGEFDATTTYITAHCCRSVHFLAANMCSLRYKPKLPESDPGQPSACIEMLTGTRTSEYVPAPILDTIRLRAGTPL